MLLCAKIMITLFIDREYNNNNNKEKKKYKNKNFGHSRALFSDRSSLPRPRGTARVCAKRKPK